MSGSEAVLETALPTDVPAPICVKSDKDTLRTRLWLATSIHRDPNNYAQYGNRNRFGHDVGDRVLAEVSQRLTTNLRGGDLAARYGSDEFVVLVENVASHAEAISARKKNGSVRWPCRCMLLRVWMPMPACSTQGPPLALRCALVRGTTCRRCSNVLTRTCMIESGRAVLLTRSGRRDTQLRSCPPPCGLLFDAAALNATPA